MSTFGTNNMRWERSADLIASVHIVNILVKVLPICCDPYMRLLFLQFDGSQYVY